jgi:hypothetical protein
LEKTQDVVLRSHVVLRRVACCVSIFRSEGTGY